MINAQKNKQNYYDNYTNKLCNYYAKVILYIKLNLMLIKKFSFYYLNKENESTDFVYLNAEVL